ncbi:hypothetical protein Scep_003379 [Stephania cephalantha]|uniref:NAC domain-containing protein n=1 Tax=Stephania cephalantha TaxID=152367 RepID=A0AAP0PVQ8_9MAGN
MEIAKLFPGFRFSPTDVELISHYLKRKIEGSELKDQVIAEVDICKCEPWDLPVKSIIPSDDEWFFFSPSGRKYPNGSQARRATEFGFWKATGKERFIRSGTNVIGTKRTLVFHVGRAPKGERTDWIMHEYCMKGHKVDKSQDSFVICRIRKKLDFSTAPDSPGIESPVSRGSPSNASASAASPVVHTRPSQVGAYGDGKLMECSLNKQSSGLNSPAEPDDEPVLIQPDGGCLPDSQTGTNQASEAEYDCFAEIMNDDIVNLDEMSLPRTPLHSHQGTAYRRIRLQLCKSGRRHAYRGHRHIKISRLSDGRSSMARAIQLGVTQCMGNLKSKNSLRRTMFTISILMVGLFFLCLKLFR